MPRRPEQARSERMSLSGHGQGFYTTREWRCHAWALPLPLATVDLTVRSGTPPIIADLLVNSGWSHPAHATVLASCWRPLIFLPHRPLTPTAFGYSFCGRHRPAWLARLLRKGASGETPLRRHCSVLANFNSCYSVIKALFGKLRRRNHPGAMAVAYIAQTETNADPRW